MKRALSLLLLVAFAALMLGATTPPTAGQRTAQCGYGQWVANDNERAGVVVPVFTSAARGDRARRGHLTLRGKANRA